MNFEGIKFVCFWFKFQLRISFVILAMFSKHPTCNLYLLSTYKCKLVSLTHSPQFLRRSPRNVKFGSRFLLQLTCAMRKDFFENPTGAPGTGKKTIPRVLFYYWIVIIFMNTKCRVSGFV